MDRTQLEEKVKQFKEENNLDLSAYYDTILDKVFKNDGNCPCQLEKVQCPCNCLAMVEKKGYCHCGLFFKKAESVE